MSNSEFPFVYCTQSDGGILDDDDVDDETTEAAAAAEPTMTTHDAIPNILRDEITRFDDFNLTSSLVMPCCNTNQNELNE